MSSNIFIEAEDIEIAFEKALKEYREEIIKEFIRQHTNVLDVVYGNIDSKGNKNNIGYIEISTTDFEFYIEDLDFIYNLCKKTNNK